MKTRAKESLVKEWMQISNYLVPIRDMYEAFRFWKYVVSRNLEERGIIMDNINQGY
jgi:hypothetical protein